MPSNVLRVDGALPLVPLALVLEVLLLVRVATLASSETADVRELLSTPLPGESTRAGWVLCLKIGIESDQGAMPMVGARGVAA
jgi:hypothetical protein